ncbi:putative transcriptional regulator, XRE familiy [Sinorhizobium fredii USDA 257]|uniref:Putative transcriptional regulator, XRE familiy n=1 Tax=Sinorhizobium fredii (strain USDA 257) TaxID=1185652 RepID=I3XB73_SINF2|nr:putative transcriptional regulator, XRE familiy [Sinorhizobium fredii USDA 257]
MLLQRGECMRCIETQTRTLCITQSLELHRFRFSSMFEFKQLAILARRRKVLSQPPAIDAFVGRRIRLRRNVLGMDEKNLGAALGVPVAQVRRYEQGACRVCAVQLLTMADVLQVHFSFFFEESPASTGGGLPKVVEGPDMSKSPAFPSKVVGRPRRIVRPALWGGRALGLAG